MGTKNNPGAYDCYAKLLPDEPHFVLMGRDKHAPAVIKMWAQLRIDDGEDPAKVAEALTCVGAMMHWRAKQKGEAHLKGRVWPWMTEGEEEAMLKAQRESWARQDKD
jgi:hypothetical protein